MNRSFLFTNFYLCLALLFSSSLFIVLSGCSKCPSEKKHAIDKCRMMLKKDWPIASQERTKQALSQWENSVVDIVPILIDVRIAVPKGKKETMLALAISDEDEDIVGIGIREQYFKADKTKLRTIEEVYPVFGDCPPTSVSFFAIPIRIRESTDEIKDDKLWEAYVKAGNYSPENLPPLFVSVPDPNHVSVDVWLYDRKGHKSCLVELRNPSSLAP